VSIDKLIEERYLFLPFLGPSEEDEFRLVRDGVELAWVNAAPATG
jgi:hypothetical protein